MFTYSHCSPAFLPPFCVSSLILSCSMLPRARPVPGVCACTFMLRPLSYQPLCLYSDFHVHNVARGKASVDPVFFMYFHCPPSFLQPFCVSTLPLNFSLLLVARPAWIRCSSCASIICPLSYHPWCLDSYAKLFHDARGTRPMRARCSPCTCIGRLLSYFSLCLYSYSKLVL